MGAVCAKNDAGAFSQDAPKPSNLSKTKDRALVSQPATSTPAAPETKFVAGDSKMGEVGDTNADQLVAEAANKWCTENEGWSYEGTWKNETNGKEDGAIVSHFQVTKKAASRRQTEKEVRFADAPAASEDDVRFGSMTKTIVAVEGDEEKKIVEEVVEKSGAEKIVIEENAPEQNA